MNRIKCALVDYYVNPNTIVEPHKNLERDIINSIPKKYSEDGNPTDKIVDEIEMLRNVKATPSEESIAEIV